MVKEVHKCKDITDIGTEQLEAIVSSLRRTYKVGTRVELVETSDNHIFIPIGTKGTVRFVDSVGTIFVSWDKSISTCVEYVKDKIKKCL